MFRFASNRLQRQMTTSTNEADSPAFLLGHSLRRAAAQFMFDRSSLRGLVIQGFERTQCNQYSESAHRLAR